MNRKKVPGSILIPILIILWIPKQGISRVFHILLFRGFRIGQIPYLIQAMPREMAMTGIFLLAVLALVVAIFKKIQASRNRQIPGLNRPRSKTNAAGKAYHAKRTAYPAHYGDDASHYVMRTGKSRYLNQLDGFLQNDLVTREEYQVLKKRYEKLFDPRNPSP